MVAGVLAVAGSFLPWAVAETGPGRGAAESGWQLFDRFGVYANTTHDVVPGGYVYFNRGLTAPASVLAGIALIGCAVVVMRRRVEGTSAVAFGFLAAVWFVACAVLLNAMWASASANYDGAFKWEVARTGAKLIGLASLLGAIGAVVALWPGRVPHDYQ
jgi:hypothetical protein